MAWCNFFPIYHKRKRFFVFEKMENSPSTKKTLLSVISSAFQTSVKNNYKTKPCRAIVFSSCVMCLFFASVFVYLIVGIIQHITSFKEFWTLAESLAKQCQKVDVAVWQEWLTSLSMNSFKINGTLPALCPNVTY